MSSRFALLLAITSTFFACSSESTNTPAGGGAGAGGSAGSAAGTGGASGGTGAVGGTGGKAGSTSGGGTGNAAGSAGQDGGLGGSAGGGGVAGMAGSGGSGGTLPATVYCGSSAPSCNTSPGRCCFETGTNKPVCQLEAAECPAEANTRILCDGSEDCATGQVCCKVVSAFVATGGATSKPSVYCHSNCTPPPVSGSRTQVCDTTKTSPTQCLTGTCKKVVHTTPPNTGEVYDPSLPIGYGVCK